MPVRQPRRREPHLHEMEPLTALPEDGVVRDAAVVKDEFGVPAGEGAIDGAYDALDPHARVAGVYEEHVAPSGARAILIAKAAEGVVEAMRRHVARLGRDHDVADERAHAIAQVDE